MGMLETMLTFAVAASTFQAWNGTEWSVQSVPDPGDTQESWLKGVSCTSATVCTAVGSSLDTKNNSLTLSERWNGKEWQIQSTPGGPGNGEGGLSAVSCTSAEACATSGGDATNPFAEIYGV
jgi:hypothetical protein